MLGLISGKTLELPLPRGFEGVAAGVNYVDDRRLPAAVSNHKDRQLPWRGSGFIPMREPEFIGAPSMPPMPGAPM